LEDKLRDRDKSGLAFIIIMLILSFYFGYGCGEDSLRSKCREAGINLKSLEPLEEIR